MAGDISTRCHCVRAQEAMGLLSSRRANARTKDPNRKQTPRLMGSATWTSAVETGENILLLGHYRY